MQPRQPITVAIARFEDLVAHGLRALIEQDGALSIVAADLQGPALDSAVAHLRPRVAILNFGTLPATSEVHRLHAAFPDTRLLVLANRPTRSEANQLLALGATACLGKENEARDILHAIHLASRGLHVLPRRDPSPAAAAAIPAGPELLTPREADVLEHLQRGYSNAQIAVALTVGVETVRTHRRNIYRKLGVRTRGELAQLTATAQ